MTDKNRDKVLIVTGASSGIGAEVARQCAAAGWQVIATARRQSELEQLGHPDRIRALPLDLNAPDAPETLLAAAREAGQLRGIVHSAGLFHTAPVKDIDFADLQAMFETNVTAAGRLLQAALGDLRDGGVFIGIGSTAGVRPVPGYAAYCASKGALVSFLQSAALELASEGIRIHVVAPGVVETPMVPNARDAAGMHPLGRVGQPGDVAGAVSFLLSDAATWMTGVVLPVDGGISLT